MDVRTSSSQKKEEISEDSRYATPFRLMRCTMTFESEVKYNLQSHTH